MEPRRRDTRAARPAAPREAAGEGGRRPPAGRSSSSRCCGAPRRQSPMRADAAVADGAARRGGRACARHRSRCRRSRASSCSARCVRRPISARARSRRSAGLVEALEAGIVVMDCALSPVQQRNLEKAWNAKVLDRTGLILEIFGRRARTARRRAAGRACASDLSEKPAGALLDPSRAPARRLRLSRRPRRDPARSRPPHDRGAARQDRARTRQGQAHARAASRQPPPRALSDRRAGRLHQCRQVDAVQPHDAGERAVRRHAVRDARSDVARGRSAARRAHHPLRHGRLHLRPADHADRGVPRHAGRGDRGRRDPACARRLARGRAKRSCTTSRTILRRARHRSAARRRAQARR